MKTITLLALFLSLCLLGSASTRPRRLQKNSPLPDGQQIIKTIENDPFAFKPHPDDKKNTQDKAALRQKVQEETKNNGIYKPYTYDNQEQEEEREKEYNRDFNKILGWAMFFGSVFLAVVLIRTCTATKKLKRQRRLRNHRVPMPNFVHLCPQRSQRINHPTQQMNPSQNIDIQIKRHQMQLQNLKLIKQQMLKQEFERKKLEQSFRNEQLRRQAEGQTRSKKQQMPTHVYGPQFYGTGVGERAYNTEIQLENQQPFQVKGLDIAPKRERINSFQTELSEEPIMKRGVQYRKGIPVGRPVNQNDNDSSFASQYPSI